MLSFEFDKNVPLNHVETTDLTDIDRAVGSYFRKALGELMVTDVTRPENREFDDFSKKASIINSMRVNLMRNEAQSSRNSEATTHDTYSHCNGEPPYALPQTYLSHCCASGSYLRLRKLPHAWG